MSHDFASLKAGYIADFTRLQVSQAGRSQAIADARTIIGYRARYETVQKATTTPWFVIGLLHMREASFNFARHLANGDKLTGRTVHKPKGLPESPEPPYPWETGAIVALRYDGLDKITDWSIAGISWAAEKYNGFGPRDHGRKSGYLYALTNVYDGGKYTDDDVWDPAAVDKQSGVLAVLVELMILCPDVADVVHGKVSAPTEAQPISIEDAHASIKPERDKQLVGFGLVATALVYLEGHGLPAMVVIGLISAAIVALLIWQRLRLQHRFEHLQEAAVPSADPDAPASADAPVPSA